MKNIVLTLATAATVFFGLANASGNPTASVYATFYEGAPTSSTAEVLNSATVSDGSVATQIDDIEDATYVVLTVNGVDYTYELLTSGANKYQIELNTNNVDTSSNDFDLAEATDDALNLAEVVDSLVSTQTANN